MNTKQIILTTSGLLLSGSLTHAAIIWDTTAVTSYTNGNTLTFQNSDVNSQWFGIAVNVTADQDGTFETLAADTALRFVNTTTTDKITFTFNFNMQLSSGSKTWNPNWTPSGNTLATTSLGVRVDPRRNDNNMVGGISATMGGGNDTLENYFGAPGPTAGDDGHTNPNVVRFMNDMTGGGYALLRDHGKFDSFSPDGNTINTTEGVDDDELSLALDDPNRASNDLSFQSWDVTFCADDASSHDFLNNSQFLFTFEGLNPTAQMALLVPEPSTTGLCLLALAGLAAKRRR